MNCKPWDLEPDVPRRFWKECALILASAEGEARHIAERNHALLHGGR